jgi:hypothetical protein
VAQVESQQQGGGDEVLVVRETDGALLDGIEQGREAAGGCLHSHFSVNGLSTQGGSSLDQHRAARASVSAARGDWRPGRFRPRRPT